MMPLPRLVAAGVTLAVAAGCAANPAPAPSAQPTSAGDIRAATAFADRTTVDGREPALPPRIAYLAGLLPLRSIGADAFRVAQPTYDGRGVLIAILDSGLDPALPGLMTTSTGERKVLDVRDFSGEGRVTLRAVEPGSDGTVVVDGRVISGFARVTALATGPYYGGTFRELTLGAPPAADLNGNDAITDEYALVVGKASDGWVVVVDTDADGSLQDERALRDYGVSFETFSFRDRAGTVGPMNVVVNLVERDGRPVLDLVMDNSSHGSHVAGIAAGRNLFGVDGFDGVAPGAQLLALKISNNTRGGITVSGSMLRALQHAAAFAQRRRLPLIINLSYGVGNEVEGTAVIDSLVNAFALAHPDVLVVISAGNDGPGLSTVGFPGSAAHALTACAVFPGVYAEVPQPGRPPAPDVLGWWSARGGEVAKPDVCAPGVAYSNVPPWRTGEEISGGTSMAAPQISGAAALLQSGAVQRGHPVSAIDLKRALVNTARPLAGTTVLDEGMGVADVPAAFHWLVAAHQTAIYEVAALSTSDATVKATAAYRRAGLRSPADTNQTFQIAAVGRQPAARLLLVPDAPWLGAPRVIEPGGSPVRVDVTYDAVALAEPGLYVGTVWALPATDTLAGASFGLRNVVVVPYALDEPRSLTGMLTPGAIARYFFAVPEGANGLLVRLDLAGASDEATLYLFEPSGQPYRGGSSVTAGGVNGSGAEILATAEDIVAGVYEAVVVAAPARAVTYRIGAAIPEARIVSVSNDLAVSLQSLSAESLAVRVDGAIVGQRRALQVEGTGDLASLIETEVPSWASQLVVEVKVARDKWRELTDFGVTVFDAAGRKLSDGPLNYAVGRQRVELPRPLRGSRLTVELLPAFAVVSPPMRWSASVALSFVADEPRALATDSTAREPALLLAPLATGTARFAWPDVGLDSLAGFDPLVEIRVVPERGAPIESWLVRRPNGVRPVP